MLRKFIFVGLGGSGGKTLRYLRKELTNWLDTVGWSGDFPAGWQMLHIDTPTKPDGAIPGVQGLPAADYLGLVMDGVNFDAVVNRVDAAGGESGWQDLAGWRVDPTFLNVPITTGAGQFRAVGRTIGLAYAGKILEALNGCYRRQSNASAGGELAEIHQLAYGSQSPPPSDPVVVVVSSLAGGTGAGLFMDVCDLLRQLPGEAGEQSFGVLYASDVFHQLGPMSTAGVQPNSLAALSELMNGYWLTANHQRMSGILAGAGAPAPIERSGPAFPFLVGAANTKGVSFGDQNEVYAMMGRALRGWASDPIVQDRLVAYTMSNWQASAQGNAVKAEVLMADHMPVFEAFGYAEVSLGTDRLRRYSRERLARTVAIWLLEGHHIRALEIDRDDSREPDQIAADIARDELVSFLDQLQLKERGEDDQVIDALRPADHESQLRSIASRIEANLEAEPKALPATSWVDLIERDVGPFAEQYIADIAAGTQELAQLWVDAMPGRITDATMEMASRHGLDATAELLRLVGEELGAVSAELSDEADEHLRWSQDTRSAIASKLQSGGKIPAINHQVGEAVWEGLWVGAHYRIEVDVRRQAKALLDQLVRDFITPLERALRRARHALYEIGFEGDGVRDPVVESWPDEAVPQSLLPPKNEFLVIAPEDFASRYDDLLRRSTRSEYTGARHDLVRSEVITGSFLNQEDSALHPVEIIQPWVSGLKRNGVATPPAQPLQVKIRLDPDDLLRRAEAWIMRPGTAFERFLGEDLRSFLDDDPSLEPGELSGRRSALRQALTAAFDAAEPLARLDVELFTLLHQRAEMPRRAVPSMIPFREHPMQEDVKDILAGALGGSSRDQWDGAFTSARNITSIAISSTLGAAHDPLVFASIMDPIVSGWNSVKNNPPGRANFWDNRRARPIEQFVPASHEILMALTRGWFTALMLGRLDREKFQISRNGGIAEFPRTLLRDHSIEYDRLAVVLESLGLAYAEVFNRKRLDALGAYIELRDLGVQPGMANMQKAGQYEQLNSELVKWIETGDFGHTIVEPVMVATSDSDLSVAAPEERRDHALQVLDQVRRSYSDALDSYRERATTEPRHLGPSYPLWPGLWSVIDKSLADLHRGIDSYELSGKKIVM